MAGLFVHSRHHTILTSKSIESHGCNSSISSARMKPPLLGWWGSRFETRFDMPRTSDPIPDARLFQHSNPSIFALMPVYANLTILDSLDKDRSLPHGGPMAAVRAKSLLLTPYLRYLLEEGIARERGSSSGPSFKIITPREEAAQGSQLSLWFPPTRCVDVIESACLARGLYVDKRSQGIIRWTPIPLYTSFEDVLHAVALFFDILRKLDE
jgi:kynureninase